MSYIFIFLIIIIFLILICFVIGKTFFNLALNPAKDKEKVFNAEHNKIEKIEEDQDLIDDIEFWRNKITVNEKVIYSFDNLKEGIEEIGPFKFEVIYTPGHKEDSITIYFEEEKIDYRQNAYIPNTEKIEKEITQEEILNFYKELAKFANKKYACAP